VLGSTPAVPAAPGSAAFKTEWDEMKSIVLGIGRNQNNAQAATPQPTSNNNGLGRVKFCYPPPKFDRVVDILWDGHYVWDRQNSGQRSIFDRKLNFYVKFDIEKHIVILLLNEMESHTVSARDTSPRWEV